MDEHAIQSLFDRMERLERECGVLKRQARRWRRAACLIVIGSVVMIVGGAQFPGLRTTIEAERFVLRDEGGKARAMLAVEVDGTAGLTVYDQDGRARLHTGVRSDGSGDIGLHDADETNRFRLAVTPEGVAAQNIYDKKGRDRLGLCVMPDGSAQFGFYDEQSGSRLGLFAYPDGAAGMALFGKDKRPRSNLGITPDGSPYLRLLDRNGKKVFAVPGPVFPPRPRERTASLGRRDRESRLSIE